MFPTRPGHSSVTRSSSLRGDATRHDEDIQVETPKRGRIKRINTTQPMSKAIGINASQLKPNMTISPPLRVRAHGPQRLMPQVPVGAHPLAAEAIEPSPPAA